MKFFCNKFLQKVHQGFNFLYVPNTKPSYLSKNYIFESKRAQKRVSSEEKRRKPHIFKIIPTQQEKSSDNSFADGLSWKKLHKKKASILNSGKKNFVRKTHCITINHNKWIFTRCLLIWLETMFSHLPLENKKLKKIQNTLKKLVWELKLYTIID